VRVTEWTASPSSIKVANCQVSPNRSRPNESGMSSVPPP
jgi:hypothetical protein